MRSIFFSLLSLGIIAASASSARAEGGACPPGYYPVGGQGAMGCAPIPGTASGGAAQQSPPPPPQPTGEWIKTWGGIAVSASTSDAGVSTGHRSKKEAERKAVSECAASGASDCRVSMTYFNQCVSWVIPSGRTGNGLSGIGTGPTPSDAERAAQGVCKNDKPGACAPVYANCTEPLFRKY
ncbi:DUF4189 domain-containing protein [Stenotrophomonas muris]|uniref:DUF4189 domain-containing protein n=1 Tax=Stenotrophomonas muris TaxID=2963283 RepID=UPI002E763825|nr:DUF4189 domain-containing protein [Stenotrophomonas muris]